MRSGEKLERQTFASVWDAICDTPEQAASLSARSDLMFKVEAIIAANDWNETQAARHCGLPEARMHEFLHGEIDKFSLDDLVQVLAALGRRVRFEVEAA